MSESFDRLLDFSVLLAQQDAAVETSKSLLDYIRSGREIGYVIIVLSFIAVGLIITQLVRLRLNRLAPPEIVQALDAKLSRHDVRGAITLCRDPQYESFLTRVVGSALVRCARSPFGFLELKSALEESGQAETSRLYRSTDAIGVIASIAPMLGLLGTVVGMVGAFDTISLTEGVTKPSLLAGSISQALITTVMGLIVAIPATMAFSYLRNRIDHLVGIVAETTEELAVHLETAGAQRGGRVPTPPAAAPKPAATPARPGNAGGPAAR
ncbi:MAG: MotA/TolQ/ExbB proton channel family protein [Phycisphaerales bacterium JB037]